MKKYSIFLFSLLSISVLQAQSNVMMDRFLARESADTGTALLLIGQAIGDLETDSSPEEALQWASTLKWGSYFSDSKTEDNIPSGKFHLALLESFSLKGGILYSLFKTPRLAAREAEYQGISTGIPYVNHPMTPLEILASLTAVMNLQENNQ